MRDCHPSHGATTRTADRGGHDRACHGGDGGAGGRAVLASAPCGGRPRRRGRIRLRQQHCDQRAGLARCGRRHGPALPRHRQRDRASRAGGHASRRLAVRVAVPGSARRRSRLPGMPVDPPALIRGRDRRRDPRPGWSGTAAARATAPVSACDDRAVRRFLPGGLGLHRHWYVPARPAWPGTLRWAGLAGRWPGRGAKLCVVGQVRQPARAAASASRRVRGAGRRDRPARDSRVARRGGPVGPLVRWHVRGHRRDGVRLGSQPARPAVAALYRGAGLLLRCRPGARAAARQQRDSYRAAVGRRFCRQRRRAPAVPGLAHNPDAVLPGCTA